MRVVPAFSLVLSVLVACSGGGGSSGSDGGMADSGRGDGGSHVPPGDGGNPDAGYPQTTGALRSDRVDGTGIGGAAYDDYGCITGAAPGGYMLRYVDDGASGTGTKASPFATLGAAIASGVDHVVICVAAGTYAGSFDLGTYGHTIVVGGFDAAFTTRDPATTPSHLVASPASADLVVATAPRDLIVDGLELSGSTRRGLAITTWGGDSIAVRNVHAHHNGSLTMNGGDDATGGLELGGGDDVTLELANSVIEENDGWHHGGGVNVGGGGDTIDPLARGPENEGFGTIASMAPGVARIHHNIIRNNRIHEPSLPHGAGLAIGMNAVVERNDFRGNDTTGTNHYGVGGAMIAQHGVSDDHSAAVMHVRANWFEGNRAEKNGSAVFFDQTSIGFVYDNVIVRNIGEGAVLVDGACGNSCAGTNGANDRNFITLFHNTIAENQGAGLAVQDSTAHLYFNVFFHDIAPNGEIVAMNGSPGADSHVRGTGNAVVADAQDFPELVGNLAVETRTIFADVSARDYRLAASPMTADLTTTATSFAPAFVYTGALYVDAPSATDFLGAPRPDGSGVRTLGAFAARAP